jgi:hypothetical protein
MKYEMTLHVPLTLIGPITELMAQDGVLVSLKAVETTDEAPPKKKHTYVNGLRNKGISARDLLLSSITASGTTKKDLETTFKSRGFATASVGPTVSVLLKEGLIAVSGGRYILTREPPK